MNPKFVVNHLDQQLGPFDEQELKMKWAAGEILPIDYVYDEQLSDWILLADRFLWAAKPVTDDGSAPPPIREENILKRTPPAARPESPVVAAPVAPVAAAAAPAPTPTPALSNTAPATESLKQAVDILKHTEIGARKMDPKPVRIEMPAPVVETAKARPADPFLKLDMSMPLAPTADLMPEPVVVRVSTGGLNKASGLSQVTLVNGVAEIDFTPAHPGHLALEVKDTTGSNIRSTEPLVVNVKALEPVQVVWQYPSAQTVGQDVEVLVRALDERGHLCEHYEDAYLIQIRGPATHDVVVNLKGGQAKILLNHTKAERWELTLVYNGAKRVALPEPAELEWQPGPAVRLVLDGPHEYLAGDPMKVKVKAVDAFGNTAKTYQGTVALEVKAS